MSSSLLEHTKKDSIRIPTPTAERSRWPLGVDCVIGEEYCLVTSLFRQWREVAVGYSPLLLMNELRQKGSEDDDALAFEAARVRPHDRFIEFECPVSVSRWDSWESNAGCRFISVRTLLTVLILHCCLPKSVLHYCLTTSVETNPACKMHSNQSSGIPMRRVKLDRSKWRA